MAAGRCVENFQCQELARLLHKINRTNSAVLSLCNDSRTTGIISREIVVGRGNWASVIPSSRSYGGRDGGDDMSKDAGSNLTPVKGDTSKSDCSRNFLDC